jgi:hypothetical protein
VRALKIGLQVDGAWFCSDRCVKASAEDRLRSVGARVGDLIAPALRLGAILLQQRKISAAELSGALARQRMTRRRLGQELLQAGAVSRETLLGALAAQSGVRYLAAIDHAAVRTAPGGLSAAEVRALGIVPFGEADGRLHVACAAPLPRAALDAMAVLMARPLDPFLVDDAELEALQQAYGEVVDVRVSMTTVKDVREGAAHIAAIAAEAGAVTLREARLDPFTWVRIAANGRVSTLLVPPGTGAPGEDIWQAATTRH